MNMYYVQQIWQAPAGKGEIPEVWVADKPTAAVCLGGNRFRWKLSYLNGAGLSHLVGLIPTGAMPLCRKKARGTWAGAVSQSMRE